MSNQLLRVAVLLFVIVLAQGRPTSGPERTVDEKSMQKMASQTMIDSKAKKTHLPAWVGFFTNHYADSESSDSASRAITPFERTKEINEKSNRKPIVWRFNSYGRVELDGPIGRLANDPNRQVEIDNSQLRCLGLQCMRILFKMEPLIAICEAFDRADFSKRAEIDYQCTLVASESLELYALASYEIICKNKVYDRNENCQLEFRLKSAIESPEATFRRTPANERERLTNRLQILHFFRNLGNILLSFVV